MIAHVKETNKKGREFQSLHNHLIETAKLSATFCESFGLEKLARIIGLVHDMGKASKAFQKRIKNITFTDYIKTGNKVDHATAGAQFLYEKYDKFGLLLSYIVAGHHGGLPDGTGESNSTLSARLKKKIDDYSIITDWIEEILPKNIEAADFLPKGAKKIKIYFVIKILYSILTDADFLDTESFMSPENFNKRIVKNSLFEIEKHFVKYMNNMIDKSEKTPVNTERKNILQQCLNAAEKMPGIFSLTVPTGGGKTLSSMAFALKHAVKYNKNRIIYVIPYTSIIEQNAMIFNNIFNDLNPNIVLEHHSNVSEEKETIFNRLASQNWDAPIIVTTNVQFFESFYNNRSSANRKLHNIAESVIIFDEAHLIPSEFLESSLLVINELVKNFGCSAVICTATQPILNRKDYFNEYLENVREIISDTRELYNKLKRVKTVYEKREQTTDEIANRLSKLKQSLAIVNTRKDARLLAEQTAEKVSHNNIYHLSTLMVPQHRNIVLDEIRKNLKKNDNCIVISTQLIEAGVDVDFPTVFRAIAGLDSVAQAAGRCNREGRLSFGEVIVFNTENQPPPGHLRRAADSGKLTMNFFSEDLLNIDAITKYFEMFYGNEKLAHSFDKKEIISLIGKSPDTIPFKEISRRFKLISQNTFSLIIPYDENGMALIEELKTYRYKFVPREIRQALYRYTIQLYENEFIKLANVIENLFEDNQFFILKNLDIYDKFVGLKPENPEFLEIESIII